jgi:hypothetical protein
MRGLSSLERLILECIGNQVAKFETIKSDTGIQENVCFNLLQALIIRGIVQFDRSGYRINPAISPMMLDEINGREARRVETLELMEAVVEQKDQGTFKFQKVAMDARDEKIFYAMLSNLESFLKDAHKKAQSSVPLKERKVIFWGTGNMNQLMKQVLMGEAP